MRAQRLAQWAVLALAATLLLVGNGTLQSTQLGGSRHAAASVWDAAIGIAASAASDAASFISPHAESDAAVENTRSALVGFRSLGLGAPATPAAARTAPAPAPAAAAGSDCLITKWAAFWRLHADGSRSHVGFPSAACTVAAASAVEDLAPFPKSHGGAGSYFLGPELSAAACALKPCAAGRLAGRLAPAEGAAPGLVGQAAAALAAAVGQAAEAVGEPSGLSGDPMVPVNGWGAGVAPAWMERSALRFNKAAASQFDGLRLSAAEPLLLVFGGASVTDMLRNWVLHVQKLHM